MNLITHPETSREVDTRSIFVWSANTGKRITIIVFELNGPYPRTPFKKKLLY